MDILIPTIHPRNRISPQISQIEETVKDSNIILSGFKVSASTNRNYCLNKSNSEIVIMMDDDMTGFYKGWAENLIKPLEDPDVIMVSARLLDVYGNPGVMVGNNYDMSDPITEVDGRELPTACIAFRKSNIRFNECFIGSGFEDNRFCHVMGLLNPSGKFVINNEVSLVHINEKKNQLGQFWNYNKNYYISTFGKIVKVGTHVA